MGKRAISGRSVKGPRSNCPRKLSLYSTCGALLEDPDGYKARCTQRYADGHVHSTARESVRQGYAREANRMDEFQFVPVDGKGWGLFRSLPDPFVSGTIKPSDATRVTMDVHVSVPSAVAEDAAKALFRLVKQLNNIQDK